MQFACGNVNLQGYYSQHRPAHRGQGQIGRRRSGAGGGARVASTQASETFAAALRQNANSNWTNGGLATLRSGTGTDVTVSGTTSLTGGGITAAAGHQPHHRQSGGARPRRQQQRKRPPRTAAGLIPARGLGSDRLPLRAIRSGTIRRIPFMDEDGRKPSNISA